MIKSPLQSFAHSYAFSAIHTQQCTNPARITLGDSAPNVYKQRVFIRSWLLPKIRRPVTAHDFISLGVRALAVKAFVP